MGIATDIRAALLAHPPLVAQVADRVCLNAANESTALPYIVYSYELDQQRGLDGSLHGEIITAEIRAWAKEPLRCNEIAETIQTAVMQFLDGAIVTGRATSYDQGGIMLDWESLRITILR